MEVGHRDTVRQCADLILAMLPIAFARQLPSGSVLLADYRLATCIREQIDKPELDCSGCGCRNYM